MAGTAAERREIRNVFFRHTMGMHHQNTLPALKEYLHQAGLLDSPFDALDLVMVDDVEHFYDLMADGGVPLARDTDTARPLEDEPLEAGEGI